jgi:hypothetical protein
MKIMLTGDALIKTITQIFHNSNYCNGVNTFIMKKLLLSFALITVSLVSANNTKTEKISLTETETNYTYVFKTSCGTYFTNTTKCYTEAELKNIYVGIEKQFCKQTVSIQNVSVTEV